jgi:hypothetical protein
MAAIGKNVNKKLTGVEFLFIERFKIGVRKSYFKNGYTNCLYR